jgi:hypothetical protein
MASASTQLLNSCAPDPRGSAARSTWKVALTVFLAVMALAALTQGSRGAAAIAILCVLCAAWQYHLQRASLPWVWSGPLAVLVAATLWSVILRSAVRPASVPGVALLSGLMLYGMIWAVEVQRSRRGLQALASIALLMPLALLTRVEVLLAVVFLGVLAMLRCGRQYGGYLASALLAFTPLAFSVLCRLLLQQLAIATIRYPVWRHAVGQLATWHYTPPDLSRLLPIAPLLVFAVAVLLIRMMEARTGAADFAYIVVLASLLLELVFRSPLGPQALTGAAIVSSALTMSLLALAPPRRSAPRFFLLLSVALALAVQPHLLPR